MTRRRWLADESHGDHAALTGDNAAHLARVLRARPGQEFDIAIAGRVRRGIVTSVTDQRVEFALREEVPAPALRPVSLMLAVFKFDRMEWLIEKATELGAERILPVLARRTDAHLARAAEKRTERWRRVAREAAQQSRRVAQPEISTPVSLAQATVSAAGTRIVLAEAEEDRTLRAALEAAPPGTLWLAVGPEGGWTEDELAAFRAAGWTSASLGPTILRAETAAIAALALAMAFAEPAESEC